MSPGKDVPSEDDSARGGTGEKRTSVGVSGKTGVEDVQESFQWGLGVLKRE